MSDICDSQTPSYEEDADQQVWEDPMTQECQSILKKDVLEIVPTPETKSVVTSRWIYKIKHVVDGSVEKFKARFVARGFSQKEGIDYEETFSLVANNTTIRSIISLASVLGWKLHQMDVNTIFLNGDVEEQVYIEQTDGFVIHGKGSHVCKLRKSQYRIKQSP